MRKLEMRPEFFNSGIKFRDENVYFDSSQNVISINLFEKIVYWNNKYLKYARLTDNNKKLFMSEIYELDKIGFNIKENAEKETNCEVEYFSEGLQKYLNNQPDLLNYDYKMNWLKKIKKSLIVFFGEKDNFYGSYKW